MVDIINLVRSSILDQSERHRHIVFEQNEKRHIDTFVSDEKKTDDNRYSSVDNTRYAHRCNTHSCS